MHRQASNPRRRRLQRLLSSCVLAGLGSLASESAAAQSANANFGAVMGAGDFDGDGISDLVAGLPTSNDGGFRAGAVEVYYGAGGVEWIAQSVLGTGSADHDNFGHAVASADFNLDGFDDLAIGAPGRYQDGEPGAGVVYVLPGSEDGLDLAVFEIWSQNSNGINDVCETGDWFGAALAVGNFGSDAAADLAVGAPNESIGSATYAGGVSIIFGVTGIGLQGTADQFFSQNSQMIADSAESGDRFGWSLGAGNFGYTGRTDLAIGVPGEALGSVDGAGAVHVLYGTSNGLVGSTSQFWHQDSPGVLDFPETNDRFGLSFGRGDFNGDGFHDLAVGVPYETVGTQLEAGILHIIYGGANGLATQHQLWSEEVQGVPGAATPADWFGQAVLGVDLNNDNLDDLIVGTPGEGWNGPPGSGAVHVLYGTTSGVATSFFQIWSQAPPEVIGEPQAGDVMGYALSAADFTGDGQVDLAIGAPGETVNGFPGAGAINLLYGRRNLGLNGAGELITQ